MFLSVFSDECFKEVTEQLPVYASWGLEYVDFRARINGKAIENQTDDELKALRKQMDELGLKTGVIQSSLCKAGDPDADRYKLEISKIDGIVRACNALDCNLVRSFNFWQNYDNPKAYGTLASRPDALNQALERFYPVAKRAKEEGLILGFENCGQSADEAIAMVDALGVPEWGLAWDVSNMLEHHLEGVDNPADYYEKCLKRAIMLHVKARGVLPDVQGYKVPWGNILRGAAALGRPIPVSIETHNPTDSKITHEEATKYCVDFIKKQWPASAPADLRTALEVKQKFERPYEDNPVNFVVVGLGMGKNRCRQIEETNGTNLYGVCDVNEKLCKEIGEQFGVKYSTDINTFLNDDKVEVMYVVTPTGLHCSVAEQCLNAGKHVLVTKPMDVNTENCDRAIKLAKEKGLIFGVDFDNHFRRPFMELKKAVDEGFFGKILFADVALNINRTQEYYDYDTGWRGTWELDGGGAFCNQGVHEVDRLITMLGMPDKVRATIATQTFDIDTEDFGMCEWKYNDGKFARFFSTTSFPAKTWYARIEIHGTKGAYVNYAGGPEGDKQHWFKDGKWTEESPYEVPSLWAQASDNFAYAVRMGEGLEIDYKPGRNSRYVLDKMYESAKGDEGWVDIEERL